MDPAMLLHLLQSRSRPEGAGPMPYTTGLGNAMGRDPRGRSRKYRMDSDWELQGPLARLPPSLIKTPNPVMPLRFEQEAGKWQGFDFIWADRQGTMSFKDDYVSPAVLHAHLKALDAYSCSTWQQAAAEAKAALRVCPLCPEAYNVLAMAAADSYEQALEYYRTAVEQGPKVLKPGVFESSIGEGKLWPRVPYRSYIRGLYGVANTLRKMGRYEEALVAYDKLLEADGNWYSWTSYVNVLALYPWVLMGAKGPKAVLDYMRKYQHTGDQFSYLSSSLYWLAAFVLADLLVTEARGMSVRAGRAPVTADDNWAVDGLELTELSETHANTYEGAKARPLFCLVHTFPSAVDMLLGDKAMPPGLSPVCTGSEREETAASLVYTTGSLWRSQPTAMTRLRRYRNTFEVRSLLYDMRQKHVTIDIQDVRHYLKAPGGIHTHALERQGDVNMTLMDTLMSFPDGEELTRDELKVLGWLIEAGVPVHNDHKDCMSDNALHMACYQAYGPEAVKLLLAAGADPFRPNSEGLTPAAMTANQGNWRELQALLTALPHLKTANAASMRYSTRHELAALHKKATVPEALLVELFHSSVLNCLMGNSRCLRCSNGIPHSRHADFYKYVDTLMSAGDMQKVHKAVLEELGDVKRQNPSISSPYRKLLHYVLGAILKAKKSSAPAAQEPSEPAKAETAAAPATAAAAAEAAADAGSSKSGDNSSKSSKESGSGAAAAKEVGSACTQPSPGVRQCWACGFKPGPDVMLQKCSGCRKALYCSRDCQQAAWKAHKSDCKKWQAERAAKALPKAG